MNLYWQLIRLAESKRKYSSSVSDDKIYQCIISEHSDFMIYLLLMFNYVFVFYLKICIELSLKLSNSTVLKNYLVLDK